VIDDFYENRAYRLLDLKYSPTRARGRAATQPPKLAPTRFPNPTSRARSGTRPLRGRNDGTHAGGMMAE